MNTHNVHGIRGVFSQLFRDVAKVVLVLLASLCGLGILGVISCVALLAYMTPNFEQLEARGNLMIEKIESYRAQHGRYPVFAAEADVELPTTRWGTWSYALRKRQDSFELSVGEYTGIKPFVLFWDSDNGYWRRDT